MSYVYRAVEILKNNGIKSLLTETKSFLHRELTIPHYRLYNWYWTKRNGVGEPVMEKDWDNLIILDACRYDDLDKQNPFESPVKKLISLGSNTTEFLQRNFLGRKCYDTVYITANPKGIKLENGTYGSHRIFHKIIPLMEEWDEKDKTVMPDKVKYRSIELQKEYPEKRMIIHFIQPHLPYIGEKAAQIRSEMGLTTSFGAVPLTEMDSNTTSSAEGYERIVGFEGITNSEYGLTAEDYREMYRESLSITLEHVEELVEALKGKTAITADHGEMFGEKPFPFAGKIFGHPKRRRTDQLCIVPWIEVESESRKNIQADPPTEQVKYDEDLIESRLENLGYA